MKKKEKKRKKEMSCINVVLHDILMHPTEMLTVDGLGTKNVV